MKKLAMLFMGCAFVAVSYAQTEVTTTTTSINTGYKDLDESVNTINQLAIQNLDAFKQDMATRFHVPVSNIDDLLQKGATPGEVYLANEVSAITKQPVDKVITTYHQHKSKGWGAVANELGIKPGSKEFFDLKQKASDKKDEMQSNSTKGDKEEHDDDKDGDDNKDHDDKDHDDKDHNHGDKEHGHGHGDKDHGDKDHGEKDHGDKDHGHGHGDKNDHGDKDSKGNSQGTTKGSTQVNTPTTRKGNK